jgi:hypothetical protein
MDPGSQNARSGKFGRVIMDSQILLEGIIFIVVEPNCKGQSMIDIFRIGLRV